MELLTLACPGLKLLRDSSDDPENEVVGEYEVAHDYKRKGQSERTQFFNQFDNASVAEMFCVAQFLVQLAGWIFRAGTLSPLARESITNAVVADTNSHRFS